MPLPSFWSRLRKARLAQVLIVYLGASWVVLQVADALSDALALPEWVLPVVVLLLLAGFVVVLATAWIQSHPLVRDRAAAEEVPEAWELDVKDLGRTVRAGRFPHLTWARVVGGGVVAFSLLFGVAGAWVLFGGGRDDGAGELAAPAGGDGAEAAAPGVAVLPFDSRGVEDELWGEGLVDLFSTNLDGVAGLRAIDSRTVLARWREAGAAGGRGGADGSRGAGGGPAGGLEADLALARSTGARYAVVGSAVGAGGPDGVVRLAARLYDVTTGEEVAAALREGAPDSVLSLVDGVSVDLVRGILVRRSGDLPARSLASITTTSVPALRAYLRAEAANRRADFAAAALAYEEALRADSTFALAAYRLGMAYGWMQQRGAEAAQERMAQAARFADRLPRRDGALLEGYHGALREGDPASMAALERLSYTFPDDPEVWYVLGEARYHLGPSMLLARSDAAAAFERAVALDSSYAPAYIHLMEIRLGENEREEADRLMTAYDAIAAHDERLGALRLAYALTDTNGGVRGGGGGAVLDTVPEDRLGFTIGTLARGGVGNAPAMARIIEEVPGTRLGGLPPGLVQTIRSAFQAATGQVDRSVDALTRLAPGQAVHTALLLVAEYGVDVPGPVLDHALRVDSTTAPDALLSAGLLAAHLGRGDLRERAVSGLRRVAAAAGEPDDGGGPDDAGDPAPSSSDREMFTAMAEGAIATIEAYAAWRDGSPDEAVRQLERVRRETIGYGPREQVNEQARLWVGVIEASRGRHEEAVHYLRSLDRSVMALLLLAESREALGQVEEARRGYANVLRIWADADDDFAPALRARRGLARLRGDRGGSASE